MNKFLFRISYQTPTSLGNSSDDDDDDAALGCFDDKHRNLNSKKVQGFITLYKESHVLRLQVFRLTLGIMGPNSFLPMCYSWCVVNNLHGFKVAAGVPVTASLYTDVQNCACAYTVLFCHRVCVTGQNWITWMSWKPRGMEVT